MKKIKSFDDLMERLEWGDSVEQNGKINKKIARKHDKLLDEIWIFLNKMIYGIKV